MTPFEKMPRVNRERPCPVCGKPDWCLLAKDESAAICQRIESPKRCGGAGWLHKRDDAPRACRPRAVAVRFAPRPPDLTALATSYQEAASAGQLTALAAELGVSVVSLTAYRVGWAHCFGAWSFPMRDPKAGTVTGIRLRLPDGAKRSVPGGKESLFVPDALTDPDDLLVLEGASDAIAAHSVGFPNAVGRPSCTGGTAHLVALVRQRKPARVVIVRDNDEPGVRGADALASALALQCRDVRVISPPDGNKDVRAWIVAGATRPDLQRLIDAAQSRRLTITISSGGKNVG
ncbi:MAG: toprim domain-containing protein [Planctomycetes bacterium]|nr:toprim domain-containing protein [Planctomycetota bacterium]